MDDWIDKSFLMLTMRGLCFHLHLPYGQQNIYLAFLLEGYVSRPFG
jgi:hypothetical protein